MAAPLWPLRDDRTLTAYAKLAYVMLWTRRPRIYPSMQTLAGDMSVSKATAKRAVRELHDAGLIRITRRASAANEKEHDSNAYELLPFPGVGSEGTQGGALLNLGVGSAGPPKNGTTSTEVKGEISLASRHARPAVRRVDAIGLVRIAVAGSYSQQEADDLCDGQAVALWYQLIGARRPADPVAYLCKIFGETPYLDTHMANAGSEEDWEWDAPGVFAA